MERGFVVVDVAGIVIRRFCDVTRECTGAS